MATIEAKKSLCSHCLCDEDRFCHSECSLYAKYLGAIEQDTITKQEMIEKAHRELYELMKYLSEAYHIPSESVNRHIERFCKTMEL